MTLAEIHGKSPGAASEDMLTANVFAAFKYLPVEKGILGFLRSVPTIGELLPQPKKHCACTYYFWPRGDLREPDVLLEIDIDGRVFHIVVEAKYYSGLSNNTTIEIDEEKEDAGALGHQLADEMRDLLDSGRYHIFHRYYRDRLLQLSSHDSDRFLLYLTADVMRPVKILQETAVFFGPAQGKVFWSSWYHAFAYLEGLQETLTQFPYDEVLHDICLLLSRKGFTTFKGFADLPDFHPLKIDGSFWRDFRDADVSFTGIAPPSLVLESRSGRFWMAT